MKQKLPRLYGITVWDLQPLLSCCWGYSLGLFLLFGENKVAAIQERRQGNYNRKSQETFDWMLTK